MRFPLRSIDDEWETFEMPQGLCALCHQQVFANLPMHWTIGDTFHKPLHEECAPYWFQQHDTSSPAGWG